MKRSILLSLIIAISFEVFAASNPVGRDDPIAPQQKGTSPIILWKSGDFSAATSNARIENGELILDKPGASCTRSFEFNPQWREFKLTGEMKTEGVLPGKESWQTARFAMEWKDKNGKTVCPWPNNHGWTGTTPWRKIEETYLIPTNVVHLNLSLCNLAGSGVVKFRNVSLVITRDKTATRENAAIPDGVDDPESLVGAYKTASATRQRYCLNGVWRCRPVLTDDPKNVAPAADDLWGWAKVPSVWARNNQAFKATKILAPWFVDFKDEREKFVKDLAWYGRSFTVPKEAQGKRVIWTFDMIGAAAQLFIDGRQAGIVNFPQNQIDITDFVKPGKKQDFAILVDANQEGVIEEYNESRRKILRKREVKHKGITADMWLDIVPKGEQLDFAWAETSVEKGAITFKAETLNLDENAEYSLKAVVVSLNGKDKKQFEAKATLKDGVIAATAAWRNPLLWDLDTPRNRYACKLSLYKDGTLLDETVPFTFGFREVKINGRDLLLNGTPVHLRALYDETQNWNWNAASYSNSLLKCRAALSNGFNAMIAGNYSFSAGAMASPNSMLEGSDDAGFMYCFTLPHFKDYSDLDNEEGKAAYREDARKIMRLARRHPSVVLYATSHNAAGYLGAGHPQRIDGIYELPKEHNTINRRYARICHKIIRELDETRPCYHHESGNLDEFHCVNCYLNWSPIQERSEWLEHWGTEGVKPLFFVEWGMPHVSSWSSYRGPQFIWSTNGYMSLWAAEHAASFRGDDAYEADKATRDCLEKEEELWKRPRGFPWSSLCGMCGSQSNNYTGVQALFQADNWRSMRAWGITANLPWDQGGLFRKVCDDSTPVAISEQRKMPGLVPNFIHCAGWGQAPYFEPSAVGKVFQRWNMPECAWIGGDEKFTDKRHIFKGGEQFKKTLVILNDRRRAVNVDWCVTFNGKQKSGKVNIKPGMRQFVPVAFSAPEKEGSYKIVATFVFNDNDMVGRDDPIVSQQKKVVQKDSFAIEVLNYQPKKVADVVLIDKNGLTKKEFDRLGIKYKENVSPENRARLIIGRQSLTKELLINTVIPHARNNGGRAVIFEQDKALLEEIGFRVQCYGLRNVFPRYASNELSLLMKEDLLRDWAGESTLGRAYTKLSPAETGSDSDTFAGYNNSRVWRNGFRGAVASVIMEKPSYGDWVPFVDGGFDLQYSPLLEWRLGNGSIVFCQMDVTGRTKNDAAADALLRQLSIGSLPSVPHVKGNATAFGMLAYASTVFSPRMHWLVEQDINKTNLNLFVVAPDCGKRPDYFFEAIKNGGSALMLGLNRDEIKEWSPVPLETFEKKAGMYSRIEKLPPELNGLSNADWAWHGLMDYTAFAETDDSSNDFIKVVNYGNGKLVFWQVPPWKFNDELRPYLRTSKRHAQFMLSRLMGNLGFRRGNSMILYADIPIEEDDPYRYFHW